MNKSKSKTNDLAVRLVYLPVQAENHSIAFCLSDWPEKQTSRKKFCKDEAKRKGWRFLSDFLKNTTRSLQNF
ncbi:hypothetical protein ACTFOF_30805 [Bacillus cereus group sp. MYBK87-2]|uniref:hypothetical protein n=1 Tax=Bacillus cereus group sp. MYBK87-2 TaxID=3450602 RepID=UPI003F79DA09